MNEEAQKKFVPPRFVEMPAAVRTDVVESADGIAIDFTYRPPDQSDELTVRLPMSREEAKRLFIRLSDMGMVTRS